MLLRRIRENQKGFTLAELLVVVAIIAILVAVSIPIFTGKLEEARTNTDLANERAAKAAAIADYIDSGQADNYAGFYDAENGVIQHTDFNNGMKGYNQTTKYGDTKNCVIYVSIDLQGGKPEVNVRWDEVKTY